MEQVIQKTPSLHNLKNKDIILEDISYFFPKGYEKTFLFLYTLMLPYISGLLFIFLYISESKIFIFTSMLDELSFFLTWCIGYELLMLTFLIVFTIKSLTIMRPKENVFLNY